MHVLLFIMSLFVATAHADGVEVRVEAVNALTKTPLQDYQVQLHPLHDFAIESTQIRTDQLGVARMTAPQPDEYLLLVRPTHPRANAETQCATVKILPDQPVTVRFELGREVPENRQCEWLKPRLSTPPAADTDKSIWRLTF